MSSVLLDSVSKFEFLPSSNDDADIEMSDDAPIAEKTIQTGLYEISLNDKHKLFTLAHEEQHSRRVNLIVSFLSLMEIAPAKALSLIKEASLEPNSQQFRDYMLFKQIFADMQRSREVKSALAEPTRKHTSSSNQPSVIGSNSQLDTLQWMFSFSSMYSLPFHHKDSSAQVDDIVLYLREANPIGIGPVTAVVIAQKPKLEQSNLKQNVLQIVNELEPTDTRTRLGLIININVATLLVIDAFANHDQNTSKAVRSVSVSQKQFDLNNTSHFAELISILEHFINKEDVTSMESSPRQKIYSAFPERDYFFIDKFNTSLSYVFTPPHLAGSYATSSSLDFHCVKKRSHFCEWERSILNRLTSHPYIVKELDLYHLPVEYETTIMLENVKPLNKRMFALAPTDNLGREMVLTQQLINNRFEILRQFLKQALHSVTYCHNNGIVHNNILSRGGTFCLDEQYKVKLLGFDYSLLTDDAQLKYRDMKHLAVVMAELMFNTQFNVSGDDEFADWTSIWDQIQTHIDKYQNMVENCPHTSANDKLLYIVNSKTKENMFDLLKQMFHTSNDNYYHEYMIHPYIGMASSMYKEKSKQKLREKTMHMLNGAKPLTIKKESVNKNVLTEKWSAMRKSTM